MEHEHGCNCEDCWWAQGQQEVDEWGVPVPDTDS